MSTRTDIETQLAKATTAAADAMKSAKTATDAVAAANKLLAALPPDPVLYIGGAYGGNADPAPFEKRAGRPMAARRTYHASDVAVAVKTIKANIAAGRAVSVISMHPPLPWNQCAAGAADAWAKNTAATLQAAVAGTSHLIQLAIHHEPESKVTTTNGGQPAWTAMTTRWAPYFDVPGVDFIVILMGYHSLAGGDTATWNLDRAVPVTPAVKGVGIDPYESWGITPKGASKPQGWKPFEGTYYKPLAAWCAAHGKRWGVSETGINAAQFAAHPSWFEDQYQLLATYGGSWFHYFNTNLNSISGWQMTAGDDREKAFIGMLRNHSA